MISKQKFTFIPKHKPLTKSVVFVFLEKVMFLGMVQQK